MSNLTTGNKKRIDGMVTVTDKKPEECDLEDIKHKKKRQWLNAIYHTGGSITATQKATGIAPITHYRWLKADPVYAHVYELQRQRSIDILEEEAIRRAVHGTEEPVYQQGVEVGTKLKYSDTLLKTLMGQRDPSYREHQPSSNQIGVWGTDGNVNIQFNIPRPESIDGQSNPKPTLSEQNPPST